MSFITVALVSLGLVASSPVLAAEATPRYDQEKEPERALPHPPTSPLRFMLVKGSERQSLEVAYVDSRTIAFSITKSGICSRQEQGKATIKGNWWLGVETDENEIGEAIAVQEYVYNKNSKCTINLRIDEVDWTQATLRESDQCGSNCHLSAESMPLSQSGRKSK